MRNGARSFMRVPPYERTITEIGFRRIDQSVSILNHHSTVRPLLRSFIMVRPTVPDDVLHVRTADVWMGVVFTKSPSGRKRGGLLGLLLCRFWDAATHDASHVHRRPASEKRQGTKSRAVGRGGAAGAMGILPRARA